MNKWLYHAAGTAGIVSGFLLLGTGSAQADDRNEDLNALGEVFSPTSGLPPLNLPADTAGPADTGYRTLPAPAPLSTEAAEREEIVGPVSDLTEPLTGTLLGGGSLGDLPAIGEATGQVPMAGPMVSQTTRNLPLVGDLAAAPAAPRTQTTPVSPRSLPVDTADLLGRAGQIGSEQLPPVIAQQLAAYGGYSPKLFDGAEPEQLGDGLPLAGDGLPLLGGRGLPLLGSGLDPITQMIGSGDLPSQVPVVGQLAGPALGGLPMVGNQGPAPTAGGRLDERPVTGEDPEYTESVI
jgi:hypothetical protein